MKNIFVPNGISSEEIICSLAQKEFGDAIRKSSSYVLLKRDIIKALRKLKSDELEEKRLDAIIGIEHLNQNDFGNFISMRFAYWGLMLTFTVMIIGDVPIYEYFYMSKRNFGNMVIVVLMILLIITSRIIHIQHDQMEYLNFKLMCISELLEERKNRNSNKKCK